MGKSGKNTSTDSTMVRFGGSLYDGCWLLLVVLSALGHLPPGLQTHKGRRKKKENTKFTSSDNSHTQMTHSLIIFERISIYYRTWSVARFSENQYDVVLHKQIDLLYNIFVVWSWDIYLILMVQWVVDQCLANSTQNLVEVRPPWWVLIPTSTDQCFPIIVDSVWQFWS